MVTEFKTVIPVCKKSAWKSVCTHALKVKQKCLLEVSVNCSFTLICIGNNPVIEVEFTCFGNKTRNGIKEPLTVIAAEFTGVNHFLLSGYKILAYNRKGTAV